MNKISDSWTIGHSPLTGTVYLGKVNKKKTMWLDGCKKDITSEFIGVVLEKFGPNGRTVIADEQGNPTNEIIVIDTNHVKKSFISQDGSSDWFVVEASKREEWNKWCSTLEKDRTDKFPEYARRIEGCPSQVEFEHPINIERKKGHE